LDSTEDLCHKVLGGLEDPAVRGAAQNGAMLVRVAGIIEKRASALLQRLT
jgi:hypothetical protein